ncbi:uncharacterized protein [Apostichopus japonicus]
MIDGELINTFETENVVTKNINDVETYDSTTEITISVNYKAGNVTCMGRNSDNISLLAKSYISVYYYVYELPILTLFVNGDVVSSKTAVEVPYKGSVKATCIAIGARPSPNLTWIIDNEGVISGQTVRLSQDIVIWDSTTQSFNVTSTVQFSPRTKNGSMVCHALTYFNDTVDKFISYVTKGRTIVTDNRSKVDIKSAGITEQTVPVILVPMTVICTAIIIMCILWAAKHAHCCHPQIPQDTLPCEMSEESVSEQPVLTSVKTRKTRPTPQRLSLELPQLPHYNSNESRRVTKPEAEHGIYSMIDESFPEFRVYREEDLCKVVTLNIGKSYTRWMGMIKESLGTKCVIITTASETAITTNDVHWDLFAKRALELPTSDYITKLEGICISSGQLHLLHENLACGTLAAHMTARKTEGSVLNLNEGIRLREVITYILGILDGLELIHSYGFVHPGLESRKVLFTKQGVCKLYDFCLSMDATKAILVKKSQVSFRPQVYPPESIDRNEYTQESDIWSFAVMTWELMSGDSTVLPTAGYSNDARVDTVTELSWPRTYNQYRNDLLFECWRKCPSLRPGSTALKKSFKKKCHSSTLKVLPQRKLQSLEETYVPMDRPKSWNN